MTEIDPDTVEARIRRSFARQGAMETLGAELSRISQGVVEIELEFDPKLTQQHGFLHAGVISAALDTACSYAAYTVVEPEVSLLTIEFKVNLMSPGAANVSCFAARSPSPARTSSLPTGAAMR